MKLGHFLEHILPRGAFRSLSRAYMCIRLRGSTYECPLCEGGFRDFYPAGFDFPVLKEKDVVGAGRRDHVRCPRCASSNRERLVYLYVENMTDILRTKRSVLHVAPEPALTKHLRSLANISYESIDIEPGRADKVMDVQSLAYPDASFDMVICNHVLEHVPDDLRAMKEFLRVLRPGGFAILQVPIAHALLKTYEDTSIVDPSAREQAFGQHDHVRLYAKDYKQKLEEAGFVVNVIPYAKDIGPEKSKKYALDVREDLYVCKKPVN